MKKRVTIKSQTWLILIVALLLCLAIVKLFYVALSPRVDGINLKEFASNRNEVVKKLYASRGTIYDSTGDALAISVNSYTLIAYLSSSRTTNPNNPQHVVDKVATAKALSPVIGLSEDKILAYLNKDAYQVEFGSHGRNITELQKRQIDDLELPGIDFVESVQRYYKMGKFASYIVGYAKTTDEGKINGELGIESYFNEELSGTDGYERYQRDAKGYQLPNAPSITEDAVSGNDIYLTIDSNIQLICENAISELENKYDFDFAIYSIMDAKTGAIVASATSPGFNPNNLNSIKTYLNPLVSYTYEPGSTMKIFSWASAIEEGIYDGDKLYESGSIEVADAKISDFNKTGWGKISYDTGFAYSSNVGATNLALALGRSKLKNYYSSYGFGKKTGIELSGELPGKLVIDNDVTLASAAFGQGITVTPIQMLQALSMIANNGVMLKPYIVSKIMDDKGNVTYSGKRTELGQIIAPSTADKMKELMYNMNYNGLSKIWRPSNVVLITKTGTAQIASKKGGYLEGLKNTIYSLAGIFPKEEPKYIIYAAVKQISGTQKNFADITTKVVEQIASYADLTEKEVTKTESNIIEIENYTSKKVETIKNELVNKNIDVVIIGSGTNIISQYPLNGSKVVKGSKVFLLTNNNGEYIMPDMMGWSLSEARIYAGFTGIKLNYTTSGYISEQSIKETSIVKYGDELTIKLVSTKKKQD